MSKILSSLFSRLYSTFSEWLRKREHVKPTAYDKRIISYIEKHPKATLSEARGHKAKAKKVRVTIGTAIYPVKKSQTKRYTLSEVVDADLVEETKYRLLEDMYRKIERDVGYDRDDWWFELTTGYEVIEVKGD